MLKILFAGGGTGGHLFPALALAEEIRKIHPASAIAFLGTPDHLEAKKVPEKNFPFFAVPSCGLKKSPMGVIRFGLTLLRAIWEARRILLEFNPDCVVGTGGYVSAPALLAAQSLGIPTFVQEQNARPGLANRVIAKRAKLVAVAFEATKRYFPRAILFGNPIRTLPERAEARKFFELAEGERLILITGGSGGSMSINRAALSIAPRLLSEGWRVLHLAGEKNLEKLLPPEDPRYCLVGFCDHMREAVAACDFVVSRAGASTLAELSAAGRPSLLIPYPHAGGHQKANAEEWVRSGAAELLLDQDLDELEKKLFPLLEKERREQMGEECKKLGRPAATKELAEAILSLCDRDPSHNGKRALKA
ncbi:MAG TPA: undecaprenyldiphospho-muramoylpentapeptide beta-N-acetylglucosaminyltransferase [Cyanobacteria bacterium UBA8530]|nr:undecaprenyldiphospho-muramoylpentapeptide beta-N-acetylglucosaminyltransferase [Cyanobacteria bacterium UBA8530]